MAQRTRVSKSDDMSKKVSERMAPEPGGRSRVSKSDSMAQKVSERAASSSAGSGRSRVSKTDEMAQKIPSRPSAQARPVSDPAPQPSRPVDQNYPKQPDYTPSRAGRSSGCLGCLPGCLLPVILGIAGIAAALGIIF